MYVYGVTFDKYIHARLLRNVCAFSLFSNFHSLMNSAYYLSKTVAFKILCILCLDMCYSKSNS